MRPRSASSMSCALARSQTAARRCRRSPALDTDLPRLREGLANTARSTSHCGRRYTAGQILCKRRTGVHSPCGPISVFYAHTVVATCMGNGCPLLNDHRSAILARQLFRAALIEAIDHRMTGFPFQYWMGESRRCRRDGLRHVQNKAERPAGAEHCPACEAGSPVPSVDLFARYIYHAFVTDQDVVTFQTGWSFDRRYDKVPRTGMQRAVKNGVGLTRYAVGPASPPTAPGRKVQSIGAQPGPLDIADWSARSAPRGSRPSGGGSSLWYEDGSPDRRAASLCTVARRWP